MNLDSVLKYSQIYNFWKWAVRRNEPEHGRIVLNQRRIYILPTRQGIIFGVALVLMLIGSINYSLSLGYVLTFLLAGMAIVSILHTFRNLAQLAVSPGKVEPVFAGETARFELLVENERDDARHAIQFSCDGESLSTSVPARRIVQVQIPVRAARRGWLALPRVTIETRFPLGLFRAWGYVQPAVRTLIYPRPDNARLPLPHAKPDIGDTMSLGTGTDDFYGLRDYQPSDSPRHIAWKAVARGESLLTKTFMGRAGWELLFDWRDLPGELGVEARLSRLARWVLLAHESEASYGLRIPGSDISLGHGDSQLALCLQALALYETAER